jgi:hypothetical protein
MPGQWRAAREPVASDNVDLPPYHATVNAAAVDVCGNCGAPLDLNEDGECRWCRAKVRARHPLSHRDGGGRFGIGWQWNPRNSPAG